MILNKINLERKQWPNFFLVHELNKIPTVIEGHFNQQRKRNQEKLNCNKRRIRKFHFQADILRDGRSVGEAVQSWSPSPTRGVGEDRRREREEEQWIVCQTWVAPSCGFAPSLWERSVVAPSWVFERNQRLRFLLGLRERESSCNATRFGFGGGY